MIWRKAWLENRGRFLGAAAIMIFAVAWAVLDCENAMAHYDRTPPITFEQYVAILYAGKLQPIWVACSLLLGAGGLVREGALGTAPFTLSLPVRRRVWTRSRALMGLGEAAALALIPAVLIPSLGLLVRHSYPLWEAFKFSALLWTAGSVFFCVTLFFSTVFAGEFAAIGLSALVAFLAYTSPDYLYRWLPYFRLADLLGGSEFVNRATGFLESWPWQGVLASVAIAAALCWGAAEAIERRDF